MTTGKLTTIALGIEYDGSAFNGWQVQPDCPTVQATLEAALEAFVRERVPTICAGRTDTGVHATGQVVTFQSPVERPLESWVRGVNTFCHPRWSFAGLGWCPRTFTLVLVHDLAPTSTGSITVGFARPS